MNATLLPPDLDVSRSTIHPMLGLGGTPTVLEPAPPRRFFDAHGRLREIAAVGPRLTGPPPSEGRYPTATVAGVILARNEGPTIEAIVRATAPFVDRVVVVDGHSSDQTRELAERAGAAVLLDHGLGKGDGIRTAIAEIDATVLVFLDADGSHDPRDIPHLVLPIVDGQADMVVGSRGRGGSDELHGDLQKLLRMIGSDIILLAMNYRWNVRLTDSQNGFRAIRTDRARALGLRSTITTIEQEMTMKCLKRGYRIAEIPTHEYARHFGESVISLRRVWFSYIWNALVNLY